MSVNVSEQGQESRVLLTRSRNVLGRLECLGIGAFAEIGIGQVEFYVIGVRAGAQGRLEMLDGVVVQMEAGEQHTYSSLSAIVARTELVKLRDRTPGFLDLSQFQICLRQQVKVLRAVRMFLYLRRQLGQIELGSLLRRKVGSVVQVIKKMLIRIRT